MSTTTNLRDALLKSLKTLPGTRQLHLHVLVSSPRKYNELFPYSKPRLRTYLQDILVLVSEQQAGDEGRVFVTAIEASVYNVPTTSCAILYVSKVDSTGQGVAPSPTSTLVQELLLYYANPTTRPVSADHLWIHVFARAQAQYLFPNSAEHPGKKPLSDVKLCAWWKRVLGNVAAAIPEDSRKVLLLHYNFPGYSEAEAQQSLRYACTSSSNSPELDWMYGHPYSQTAIPLPCPRDPNNLGHSIPKFDDDPKSRFMDDLAYSNIVDAPQSPPRKKQRTASRPPDSKAGGAGEAPADSGKPISKQPPAEPAHAPGELSKVSADEFWERMSFRQECVSGAVTGFFTLGLSSALSSSVAAPSPLAPQPGQVSSQINRRILSSLTTGVEFSTSERAVRGTEIVETTLRGLCEGIAAGPSQARDITEALRDRKEEEQSSELLAPPMTPPRKASSLPDEISPNPFPEPHTSLETYHAFIYGSVDVANEALLKPGVDAPATSQEKSAPHVTVLTARKKKKT